MKKILFFIESLAGGGAEKVLTDLVSNLDCTKYEITVCTVTDDDVYQKKIEKACNYRTFLHKRNYYAGGMRKVLFWLGIKLIYNLPASIVYKVFIREKYDIEIAFVEGFATKLIAQSYNSKSKKIAWIHTNMLKNPHADSLYITEKEHKETYEKYDKLVCVSQSVKDAFQNKFALSRDIIVQYNPVDERYILKKAKELCDMDVRYAPVLCAIGRLEEVKGYKRLVKIAKDLINEGYKFELWIVGDGSQRDKLQEYITNYNIDQYVKLIGFQENPYKYLCQSDAFICSSYEEGFSTAATESMILGKPIFTVECAGMKELFGNVNCGEIVENSDNKLYELLKRIVSQSDYVKQYVYATKQKSKEFKLETRIDEIEKNVLC